MADEDITESNGLTLRLDQFCIGDWVPVVTRAQKDQTNYPTEMIYGGKFGGSRMFFHPLPRGNIGVWQTGGEIVKSGDDSYLSSDKFNIKICDPNSREYLDAKKIIVCAYREEGNVNEND